MIDSEIFTDESKMYDAIRKLKNENGRTSYLEIITEFCDNHHIEVEEIVAYLPKCLITEIEVEAANLNLLKTSVYNDKVLSLEDLF